LANILQYKITVEDDGSAKIKKFTGEIDKVGQKARASSSAATTGFRNMKTVVAGVTSALTKLLIPLAAIGTVFAGIKIAKGFIEVASTIEQLQIRLEYLTGSVEDANRLFKDMSDLAARVPFEYKDIMDAATTLAGALKGNVDEVNKWMRGITDLAAVTGFGVRDTTEQVIRMLSAGAQAAERFKEKGILGAMGFQTGVSYALDETRRKLSEYLRVIEGASNRLAGTWKGMMSMLSDAWFRFRSMVMDAGLFNFLKAIVDKILETVRTWEKTGGMAKFAKEISDTIISAIEKAGVMLLEFGRSVLIVFRAILTILNTIIGLIDKVRAYLGEPVATAESVEEARKEVERIKKELKEMEKMKPWSWLPWKGLEYSIKTYEELLVKATEKYEKQKKELESRIETKDSIEKIVEFLDLLIEDKFPEAMKEWQEFIKKGKEGIDKTFPAKKEMTVEAKIELKIAQFRVEAEVEKAREEAILALRKKYDMKAVADSEQRWAEYLRGKEDITVETNREMNKAIITLEEQLTLSLMGEKDRRIELVKREGEERLTLIEKAHQDKLISDTKYDELSKNNAKVTQEEINKILKEGIKEAKDIWARLGEAMKAVWEDAFTNIRRTLSDFLYDTMTHVEDLESIWKRLAKVLIRVWADLMSAMIMEFLRFKKVTEGEGFAGTSWTSGLLKLVSGVFGIGGGGGYGGVGAGLASSVQTGSWFAGGYQRGGIISKPSLITAGERGAEAIVPLPGGREIPVQFTGRQQPSGTVVIINAVDAKSFSDMAERNKEVFMKIIRSNAERAGLTRGLLY